MIEIITNIRFDIYMENALFKPMGLGCSFNVDNLDHYEDLATLYVYSNGKWIPQFDDYHGLKPKPRDLSKYVVGTNGFILGPQGGCRASAEELRELIKLHIENGVWNGKRILSKFALDIMHSAAWVDNGNNGDDDGGFFRAYGLATHITTGFKKDYVLKDFYMFGHTGSAYGLSSSLWYNPQEYYGIFLMTNGAKDNYPNSNTTEFFAFQSEIFDALAIYYFNK